MALAAEGEVSREKPPRGSGDENLKHEREWWGSEPWLGKKVARTGKCGSSLNCTKVFGVGNREALTISRCPR